MKEDEIRPRTTFNRYLELIANDVSVLFRDKSQFISIDCPACGSEDYHPQFEKLGFTYVLCTRCSTLFVNPRPTPQMLMDFYTKTDSAHFFISGFFQLVAECRRKQIFQPRAKYVSDLFPELAAGMVGDIGAGFGLFLEELAHLWPTARLVAVEPSPRMANICQRKGLDIIACAVEELQGRDDQFDLLTSFELFEHLCDPNIFLQQAWRLLRPGGHLVLTTLNGQGFDIQVLWEMSKSVVPPHHLNFFTPKSLSMLLRANNFIVEKVDTPGELDWDIVEGMYRNEGVEISRFWKLIEKQPQSTKDNLQSWIAESMLSSHIRVIATKPAKLP